jgi:hypothetical protein
VIFHATAVFAAALPDMGASGWSYFVPFDPDPSAALIRLKAKVRKSGEYYRGAPEDGTHSILDIRGVHPDPVGVTEELRFGVVAALPDAELVRLLGTAEPDMATVVAHIHELQALRGRWTGTVVSIYEAGAPRELFFTGFSGD